MLSIKPTLNRNSSHLTYLEPPHSHDPTVVSDVASLPSQVVKSLPQDVQAALHHLQQSTSIVYASYIRLQDSLEERFDRLLPSCDDDGEFTFSEPSFLTYANSLCAERRYLLSDAFPDWRHKASVARVAVKPYFDLAIMPESALPGSSINILCWLSSLQLAVESWCEYAKEVYVPEYEDTVAEFLSIQKNLPSLTADLDETPLETPHAISTPNLFLQSDHLAIPSLRLKDNDFSLSDFPEDHMVPKAVSLGLGNALETKNFANTTTTEILQHKNACVREERKDSGVGMT